MAGRVLNGIDLSFAKTYPPCCSGHLFTDSAEAQFNLRRPESTDSTRPKPSELGQMIEPWEPHPKKSYRERGAVLYRLSSEMTEYMGFDITSYNIYSKIYIYREAK